MARASEHCDAAALSNSAATPRARLSWFAGAFAVLVATLVLVGWQYDIEQLKRVTPASVAMNPATAICVLLSGVALLSSHFSRKLWTVVLGVVVATIGCAKLSGLLAHSIPIDQLLFSERLSAGMSQPNRMAPNTAAAILMTGLALILATDPRRSPRLVSQALSVLVQLIAMFALVGYTFSIHPLSGARSHIPMALHTAIVLFVIACGVIHQSRNVGLVPLLQDSGPAGSMIRTALPAAVFIPIAVGGVALWGEAGGYYDNEAAVALQVVANVVGTSSLLIFSIVILSRRDRIRRDREISLQQSEQINRTITETRPECVSLLDEQGRVVYYNEAALRAFGFVGGGELLGLTAGDDLRGAERAAFEVAMAAARIGRVGRFTHSAPGPSGETRWFETEISRAADAAGQSLQFIVTSSDVTERRRIEEQARWTAGHDLLTQLPNRSLFQARLDELTSAENGRHFALLLLNIDDFKRINDTLGHDAGDALLSTVSVRLRAAIRPVDFVARLGGDEFGIILAGVDTSHAANSAAANILKALRSQWAYRGRIDDCKVRVGIRVAKAIGERSSELLKDANIALGAAKDGEHGRVVVFKPEMRLAADRHAMQLTDARHAIAENLIVPFYQPKVELRSGRVVGFEALLRWMDPTHGVKSPISIEAAFHNDELAQELTERMLSHAIADMRRWLDAGFDFGHVAINATAADFKPGDFADRLLRRLDTSSIPRTCLQVEVTETVFLGRGAEYVERTLRQLSQSGIRIALDDFGTGYASLTHLKELPVDVVKIDRSFLADILHDGGQNAAIIRAVVNLGNSLGLEVVAEGVETAGQEAYLLAQGCKLGQGFLYGKAAPAMHVPGVLSSRRARPVAA